MEDLIQVKTEEKIATVTLNRPKAFNAFNLEMITELSNKLNDLASNELVRGVCITGNGKAFCAGGDLAWVTEYSERFGSSFHRLAVQFHAAILEIRRMKKPVIAAINGIAAGGGFSLALACDFRILEKSAVLRQAYTSNGLCIDGGGTYTLPRLVGMAKALEIAAFDQPITAEKALEWGLTTQVVEDGKSVEAAVDLLKQLANGSIHAFGTVKNLLNDSFDQSFESTLEAERNGLSLCGNHADGKEGINAFTEKRKPVFNK